MTTEENKRMLALSYIVADLKAENIEMTQRVHQLMDDYNEAVRQQHGLEMRKDENSSKQTLGEMMKMRDHCDELERKNGELERLVHKLTDDYNDVAHQLGSKEERESRQTLVEMQQMRDHCDELERENKKLKGFKKEIHAFMEDKKLYAIKGEKCPYNKTVSAMIGYAYCQECSSFLGVIEGLGVICKNRMAEAKVSLPADE
nr:MAG TPA_asm: hypothetical protein [Caudoviricetes sp.]